MQKRTKTFYLFSKHLSFSLFHSLSHSLSLPSLSHSLFLSPPLSLPLSLNSHTEPKVTQWYLNNQIPNLSHMTFAYVLHLRYTQSMQMLFFNLSAYCSNVNINSASSVTRGQGGGRPRRQILDRRQMDIFLSSTYIINEN